MSGKRVEIAEALRQRILGLVRVGALRAGDRLPSCRQLASEFDADPRVIQASYRLLANKGLVVLRPRSGIFLRSKRSPLDQAGASIVWLADVFSQAIHRDIAAPQFVDVLRRALDSRTIRVATVATTIDQNEGMCRELREDYGLMASCVSAESLSMIPQSLRDAELIVTTATHETRVRAIAAQLGTPVITGSVRRDLVGPGWRRLLRGPVYVIVADPLFLNVLRPYFGAFPGSNNIHYLVAGRDDVSIIPPMAPVYITSAARDIIGVRNIPGRPLPTARVFAPETTRQVLRFVVQRQLETALGDTDRERSTRTKSAETSTGAARPPQ